MPELVQGDWVKPGATVIDVGMNRTDDGLIGDVDFEAAAERARADHAGPGGVGPMTIAMLLRNTLLAAKAAAADDAQGRADRRAPWRLALIVAAFIHWGEDMGVVQAARRADRVRPPVPRRAGHQRGHVRPGEGGGAPAVLASAFGWIPLLITLLQLLFGDGGWVSPLAALVGWVGSWLSLRDESTPGAVASPARPARASRMWPGRSPRSAASPCWSRSRSRGTTARTAS